MSLSNHDPTSRPSDDLPEGAGVGPSGGITLSLRAQLAYLWEEWRLMFRPSTMPADLAAGIAVALVALPLSLAIANASGVKPEVGLVTAVIGGVVVSLFGGCRLQVSGPAAAMTFLVYEILTKYGTGGLLAATLLAGLLQVAAGVFRLGRLMQFIPRPVVAGFLSGIGLTILCTQLPVILGYEVSHDEEGGALALLWSTLRQVGRTEPTSMAVGLLAMATMIGLPRVTRKLPVPLVAVAVASLLPWAMGWSQVALLGEIPTTFPMPRLPEIPWGYWNELVMAALTVALLASIESLLSASVVASMAKDSDVDNDQELVGQGLGNITSTLFGGLPVTGVIARSATNIQAGARTRLAALAHALILLAMMLILAPLVARIPRAALAGVLCAVALRMIEVRMFKALWHGSRVEAAVFLATLGGILVTDLIDGVQIGMVATFLYFVYEMSRLQIETVHLPPVSHGPEDEPMRCPKVLAVRLEGPLFFASGFHLRNMLNRLNGYRCLILDMQRVPFLDVTGAEILEEGIALLRRRGVEVLLARVNEPVRRRMRTLAQAEFHALQEAPIFADLRDAWARAATLMDPGHLCISCRAEGRCVGLERAIAAADRRVAAPPDGRPRAAESGAPR